MSFEVHGEVSGGFAAAIRGTQAAMTHRNDSRLRLSNVLTPMVAKLQAAQAGRSMSPILPCLFIIPLDPLGRNHYRLAPAYNLGIFAAVSAAKR